MSQSAGIHTDRKGEPFNMMSFLLLMSNHLIPPDSEFFTVPSDSFVIEFQPICLLMMRFFLVLLVSIFIEKIIKAGKYLMEI